MHSENGIIVLAMSKNMPAASVCRYIFAGAGLWHRACFAFTKEERKKDNEGQGNRKI